jgi:hypothetical protein
MQKLLVAVAVSITVSPVNVAAGAAHATVRHDGDLARSALQRW